MLLLDTHVWIWAVEGDERRIGRRTQQRLARDDIRISPVSLFEVATLHTTGRVAFSRTLEHWIRDGLEQARIAEFGPTVAVDAGHIPRSALADPMDRLLVATARQLDAILVTADRAILHYARAGGVRVHDAAR